MLQTQILLSISGHFNFQSVKYRELKFEQPEYVIREKRSFHDFTQSFQASGNSFYLFGANEEVNALKNCHT